MNVYIEGIIYTFLYVVLCKMFLDVFAMKRKEFSWGKMGMAVIVLAASDYLVSLWMEDFFFLKQGMIVVLGIGFSLFCYKFSVWKSGVLILLYQGLCMAADYIVLIGLQKILMITVEESDILPLLMGTMSQLLVFCFILVLQKRFLQEKTEALDDFAWTKFSVFPIFTIVALSAIFMNFRNLAAGVQADTLFGIAVGMLILNIFVFYLLWDAIEKEAWIAKERLFQERTENEMRMYQQVLEHFDDMKRREHEYKNQITAIASLLKQSEIEKVNALLDQYHDDIAHRVDAIDTGNVVVNTILNTKCQEAKENGILFVLKFNDLSGLRMEDQDIVIVLSNLLNNALEACEKCSGKKIIKMKLTKEKERTIISVINAIGEIPQYTDGEYRTTKEPQFHGMGIKNIREIVDKYGGTCAVRHDKEQFYFVIFLPN